MLSLICYAVLQMNPINCRFIRIIMDYRTFAEMFYSSHYLPLALYEGGEYVSSYGFPGASDPYPFIYPKLKAQPSPAVAESSDTGFFGMVSSPDGRYSIVLGPAYTTPVTDSYILSYMQRNALSPERREETEFFLRSIPLYSYPRFLNLLLCLHFILTGEKKNLGDTFGLTDAGKGRSIGQKHTEHTYTEREEQHLHGSYLFEKEMLALVENGDEAGLVRFLKKTADTVAVQQGKLAENPLRQAKNIFIGWVTMVGKNAAIPGGLDTEQVYHLIDTYIQECEKMKTEGEILNLQYIMITDFTRRVARHRLPEGISKEVHAAVEYIGNHLNENISVADVVRAAGISRSSLFSAFRIEMKTGIGEYIRERRIREAESLLRFTDKSISEISHYLCFSSQSHFQNVFREETNMTPNEYRRRSTLR